MTKPSDKRCDGCEYFEMNDNKEAHEFIGGWCHRYPPVRAKMESEKGDGLLTFDFAEVDEDDWCGEHLDKWP